MAIIGEEYISFFVVLDDGQQEFVCTVKKLAINLPTADNEDCLIVVNVRHCGLNSRIEFSILLKLVPWEGSGENDISSMWKWSAEGFKCLSSHHHSVAGREFFKSLQILRNVPGDFTVLTDDSVVIEGCYNNQLHRFC